ncbi:MAG: NADH-quinone oxidoreductase subunit L [Polyangiaceae bacterium]
MEHLLNIFPPGNCTLLAVILGLPLLGAFVNGVFGRRIGREGVRLMALSVLGGAFVAALFAFGLLLHQAHAAGGHGGEHGAHAESAAQLSWTAWKWLTLSGAEAHGPVTLKIAFMVDPLSGVMMLVVTGVGFLIHLYSSAYMWEDPGFHRFFAYLNLFVFSMLVLILGDSLPMLFVGWEGVGLCSYLLIGFWFTEEKNAAAGQKAFVANRIGDFGILIGTAMLLYYTGALDFAGIHAGAEGLLTKIQIWPLGNGLPATIANLAPSLAAPVEVYAVHVAGLALFLGCAGKSAQIPLYVWLPDAMAGPTPVSALIHAATMVTAGIYLVCRLSPVFALSTVTMTVIATTGALTALFAASIGLVQNDIKKVLAYSTVSQLGYMFLGVGVGAFTDGFFHVFTHAFFKACLFLGSGSVIHAMHARIHDTDGSQDMRNMGGLRKYMPITHATYLIACLAIAGVPGFAGFFSKDEILAKAWENHIIGAPKDDMWHSPDSLGKVLFAIGIIAATMTAFYMFRTYFLTFWGDFKGWKIVPGWKDPHAHDDHGHHDHHESFEPGSGREHLEGPEPHESPWQMTLPLGVLAFMSIASGYLNAALIGEGAHIEAFSWLHHWLAPVFAGSSKLVATHPFEMSSALGLAVPGIGAAVVGIGFAYFTYMMQNGEPVKKLAAAVPGFHQLLLDKWRVDELYEASVLSAVDELAETAVQADRWIIDMTLARVTAWVVQAAGFVLRLTQTGRVATYATSMVIGTIAVGWFFYVPHADLAVSGDPDTGAYEVQVGNGVGYRFRWDADADGKWDSAADGKPEADSFTKSRTVSVKVEPGKSKKVRVEVENAFHRRAVREIEVKRPKREVTSMSELQDLAREMQKQGNEGLKAADDIEKLMKQIEKIEKEAGGGKELWAARSRSSTSGRCWLPVLPGRSLLRKARGDCAQGSARSQR